VLANRGDLAAASGIRGIHVDTANAGVVLAIISDVDVALITPAGTPRVLHNPVRSAAAGDVANNQNTVVERGAAAGVI
jgi:hypothetical protein